MSVTECGLRLPSKESRRKKGIEGDGIGLWEIVRGALLKAFTVAIILRFLFSRHLRYFSIAVKT